MLKKNMLEKKVTEIELDKKTVTKLLENNIETVKDIWSLKRKNLKEMKLTDSEINQIIIKLQLYGLDLNCKCYEKN